MKVTHEPRSDTSSQTEYQQQITKTNKKQYLIPEKATDHMETPSRKHHRQIKFFNG